MSDAVGDRGFGHGQGLFQALWPVIKTWQDMAMYIDHAYSDPLGAAASRWRTYASRKDSSHRNRLSDCVVLNGGAPKTAGRGHSAPTCYIAASVETWQPQLNSRLRIKKDFLPSARSLLYLTVFS